MRLIKCKVCKGTGKVFCCNGHMCPGEKDCFDCNGKGKQLSKKDKETKARAERLRDYK